MVLVLCFFYRRRCCHGYSRRVGARALPVRDAASTLHGAWDEVGPLTPAAVRVGEAVVNTFSPNAPLRGRDKLVGAFVSNLSSLKPDHLSRFYEAKTKTREVGSAAMVALVNKGAFAPQLAFVHIRQKETAGRLVRYQITWSLLDPI